MHSSWFRRTLHAGLATLAVMVSGCAMALTVAPPASAWRPLSLEVAPGPISAGDRVAVTGAGFRGNGSGSMRWNGRALSGFHTDVHGRFHSTVTVPTTAPGAIEVSASVGERTAVATITVTASTTLPPLTWKSPNTSGYATVVVDRPGTYELRSGVDYLVVAPRRIDGPVHLRGGRNVVWVGGHIRIPVPASVPATSASRRGLVISDMDATRGDPALYGYSRAGRVVHLEGLLVDGPGLTEGINTNAPTAIVQLENNRVDGVGFYSSDDRDGTRGWTKNHPDVLQTWGSQRELRVDGLSGTSSYQGIFLKEDAVDSVGGPVWLRRVNMRAVEKLGPDGTAYAGHRMLSWYGESVGTVHLDPGTVWVQHHPNSGWNRARPNPDPSTDFWRGVYWSIDLGRYVAEPTPGDATFTDALGNTPPTSTAVDTRGTYAKWTGGQVLNWTGSALGRVYSGVPKTGDYVPAASVGIGYLSPG